MLSKLLKSRRDAPAVAPSVPPGTRYYAIGDIHGCRDLLDRLLDAIEADDARRGPTNTTIVVLGDVVDRGPESARVVDRLIRLKVERPATRFIKGNHEEMFLGALAGDPKMLRIFCRVGGRETILSYGMVPDLYERLDYDELASALQTLVPTAHRDFLDRFEDVVLAGGYAFVHAGIRPDVPLESQKTSDLRWIRERFLDHRGPFERVIVHGHTISEEVDRRTGRIGIDTGAYATGRLTALMLEGNASSLIQT